jgi:predicted PurR-regulated permease PerM
LGTLVFNESVQSTPLSPVQNSTKFDHDRFDHQPPCRAFPCQQGPLITKLAEIEEHNNYIFVNLTALTQNTLGFLVQFAIMLYTLFFFIRDGEKFLKMAMRVLPLGEGREKFLFERFFVTARSTLKVTLIIGGIQGALGGIVFLITGIEGALIWGLLMVIMAVVPAVGCAIIWAPAGIIMLMGHI